VMGNLKFSGNDVPIDVALNNLNLLVEGTLDPSTVPPAVKVSLVACSLDGYRINRELKDFLLPYPGWALLETFTTPANLAGILNGQPVNGYIVDAINGALKTGGANATGQSLSHQEVTA
jgi:hypothetical protein